MKKVISTFLVIAMLLSFAACNGAPATSQSSGASAGSTAGEVYPENGLPKDVEVTLKMCVNESGTGSEFKEKAVEQFMERFPNVTIEFTAMPAAYTLIDTKIQAGDIDDMYDIIEYDSAEQLIAAGKIEMVDDLWDRTPYDRDDVTMRELTTDVYYELSYTEGWPDGEAHVSAFPFMGGSGGGLYFNKKQFEEHGWNQNPRTWQEFLDLCEDIKADGVAPIVFTGVYGDYLNQAFGTKPFELAEKNGNLEAFTENYRTWQMPLYTTPEYMETYERISSLGQKGYFADGIAALNHTQAQMKLLQGEAAMCSTGTWVGNEMADATPEDFEWGFMGVPFGDDPDDPIWLYSSKGWGYRIWAEKPELNKKWAKELCLWMVNMDLQEDMAENGGMIPTIRSDYAEDEARMEKVQEAPRAYMDYINNNNVKFESLEHRFMLTSAKAAQAQKTLDESYAGMATGSLDYKEVLARVDALYTEGLAEEAK